MRNKCKRYNIKIMDFRHDKLDLGGFVSTLLSFSPDIIGFSSLTSEFNLFKKLSILAKNNAPGSIIISGGPLATNYYIDIVKNKLTDFAVIGEGELTIDELLDVIHNDGDYSSVKGIAYLKDDKVILTAPREFIQDLDKVPFPAWDLIDLKSYSRLPNWNSILARKYYAPILTSRGCVYNCIFCHNLFGKKIRARTPQNVLSEIEFLYKEYDIREFHIIDDLFNFDLERVKNICNSIIEKKLKIKIAFPNGMRVDRIDKETLKLLKKAGTYKINFSIESASPRLQKFMKKDLNFEKAKEVIEEASRLGILTFGYFMFGFPTETAEEMKETLSFAVNSKLDAAKFFKATAFCNTELAKLTPDFIYGDDLDYPEDRVFYDKNINYAAVPTAVLNSIILECHWKFYTKLSRIFRIFIKYRFFGAIKKLFDIYRYILMQR